MTGGAPTDLSSQAQEFQWLVGKLAAETPGVRDAIAVSADGLLIAASDTSDRPGAQRLAAVVSGLISLAGGAARGYRLGGLHKVIIDLTDGYIIITAMSAASVLGVIAEKSASLGTVAYEMTMFSSRVGHMLTPATIVELKNAMA
jgi:predicted regulator of Ras-like GTPase activity (Roadblock/LC7/MglB family)